MKRLVLAIVLLLPCMVLAQVPEENTKLESDTPLILSVSDLLKNYGLDSAWVNDTAAVVQYLSEQPQNYAELANLCVSIRMNAQSVIASIESEYELRDSVVWIDSNTIIGDYQVYEFRLRRLADLMGRMSIKYSRLEQQRIEEEKEAARLRAIEEARRQQEERNKTASDLRSNIEVHHRAIIDKCDGAGVSDKGKLKDLKDLYYSYLMVYNKYDLTEGNATDKSIAQLAELNTFQNDMLENVLGNNSLLQQIENFKNVLKIRCEKGNSDIYRSYSKVFKHTRVPIAFGDVGEYEEYVERLKTVIDVQQRYLQTLDLRADIASGTEAIGNQYGKKYKEVVVAYKDVLHGLNQTPTFTTNAESLLFIRSLEDFIAAQKLYVQFFSYLEDITQRGDSIVKEASAAKQTYDVGAAYKEVASGIIPIPKFKDPEGAKVYEKQLEDATALQRCYMEVLRLRKQISLNDDTLTSAKKMDRVLSNGYKLIRKQTDLRPSFSTVGKGTGYLDMLRSYIGMQELCIDAKKKLEKIKADEVQITGKDVRYKNIIKAYNRMYKAYNGVSEITNRVDLERYDRQCDRIIEMQQAFIRLLQSGMVKESDSQLRRESDVEKIKLVIGL